MNMYISLYGHCFSQAIFSATPRGWKQWKYLNFYCPHTGQCFSRPLGDPSAAAAAVLGRPGVVIKILDKWLLYGDVWEVGGGSTTAWLLTRGAAITTRSNLGEGAVVSVIIENSCFFGNCVTLESNAGFFDNNRLLVAC